MTPNSDLQQRTQARQQQNQQRTDVVAVRTQELAARIAGQRAGLGAALADRIGPERFIRAAVTSIRTTEHLAECTDDSILGALYVAAQLGLEVGGPRGLVYLVPFKNKGTYEATLIVGYRGWVELIYAAGARSVQWFLIREGDYFVKGSDSERGLTYQWTPASDDETRRVVGVVAQAVTGAGGLVWVHLTREQIDKRATGSPFWRQWFDEMALKTGLRALVKLLSTTPELAIAAGADETVQRRVEVPGLPAEQRTEHLPVLQQQPQPGDARSPRPRTKPLDVEKYPARTLDDVDEHDVDPEPEPLPEPPDDWEARERADADAYLAEHEGEQ